MHSETAPHTLDSILESFREDARHNRDLGDLFERLIANYLVTDPQYADLFSDVWLWSEWPYRWGQDHGIDVVAREAATGEYWAIQCKFYLPEHPLSKKEIDSFVAESAKCFATDDGEYSFTRRMLVSTTKRWGSGAEAAITNLQVPVTRLTLQDLENSPVDWSRFDLHRPDTMAFKEPKSLRSHQTTALTDVVGGFESHDRGRLIMACGTGKTFVALRIAEALVPPGGRILFLAPSISLVGQSLREWTADAETSLHPFAVCSDTKVSRDRDDISVRDLAYPATTNPKTLADTAQSVTQRDPNKRMVVFSTYHSIEVVTEAQNAGLGDFDLIICDEAHRTTGLTRQDETSESHFVRVHSDQYVKAAKRLYMTATPRIFSDASRQKADEKEAVLYSMDDETRFGPQFHRLGFGEAVRKDLLCDYRVLLVAVDQTQMAGVLNTYSAELDDNDEQQPPKAVDSGFVAKVFGAWKGMAKKDVRLIGDDGEEEAPSYDRNPMKRAIAFSNSINNSKTLTRVFPRLVDLHQRNANDPDALKASFQHVDGSMNALERQAKIDWLRGEDEDGCRVLSNARCLSEGIDVPALDGVVFFDTRDSVVDIVQSVGRVMRKPADGHKQHGYIVLPVGIPSDQIENYDSYISGDPRFKGIWKVIKALRAHDESLVDEAEFRNKIQVIDGGDSAGDSSDQSGEQMPLDLPPLPIGDISEAVYTAIPKKLGDTAYWQDWAKNVAQIAQNVIARINDLLNQGESRRVFDEFLDSLHRNLNPGVSEQSAVEMLAQHMVTRPVFDALFPQQPLQTTNPVSKAMEDVVDHLDRHGVESETGELARFYDNIRERAGLAQSEKARQDLIRSLYDSFFATAFEDVANQLGIVYTPVEIVDFILHSADDVLREHFGFRLTDDQVHVLDPFAGTGTFITRLLQHTDLINDADLDRKYAHELHANEIVLLAYYVATVNIESAFDARRTEPAVDSGGFPGMVLTDSFQMREDRDWVDEAVLADNNKRIERQQQTPIKVIVGNPPYSVGQGGEKYPRLDARIAETYADAAQSTNKNSLYDSYIRAIRWASDRIEDQGVVAFVTNGGWLDGNTTAGLRQHLGEEFSAVYIFDLRGNANTQGEIRSREKGNVFGGGTKTPITITLLIKTSDHTGPAEIHYHDIGDYLSTRAKLDRIAAYGSVAGMAWETIRPNRHHDWINQRSEDFYTLKPLYGDAESIFSLRSGGNKSNRDPWVYNGNRERLSNNIKCNIDFYEAEVERLAPEMSSLKRSAERIEYVKKHARVDESQCKWTSGLYQFAARQYREPFDESRLVLAQYRPFARQWFYDSKLLNERRYRIGSIFPTPAHENRVIHVTGTGTSIPFSCLITNTIVDIQSLSNGQCHPLHYYEPVEQRHQADILTAADVQDGYIRHDAITDAALADFRSHYDDTTITKEGIFYYIYGVLHSPDYRSRYGADLKKESPRVPYAPDFHAFRAAGERLADLHIDYESVTPYPLTEQSSTLNLEPAEYYRVKKMRFAGKKGDVDQSEIVVNDHLSLKGIPDEAHEYVVNGKTALGWIIERYQYTRDKDSGVINDPSEWSDDPRYIVDLIARVVTVSVETVRIINDLPSIDEF